MVYHNYFHVKYKMLILNLLRILEYNMIYWEDQNNFVIYYKIVNNLMLDYKIGCLLNNLNKMFNLKFMK